MKLSNEEIAEVMEIQKRIEAKIAAHQKEIKQLEKNWEILDRAVTESSFTNAADMMQQQQQQKDNDTEEEEKKIASDIQNNDTYTTTTTTEKKQDDSKDTTTVQQIKDSNTGQTIASAYKTADHISIIISQDNSNATHITKEVEPFGSFFLERILGGMQKKDAEDVQNNTIPAQSALDYDVESDPDTDQIRSITIRNYRSERRATEIINTAGWSFTKMLESVKATAAQGR